MSISGIGHTDDYYATFNVCGFGCHVRTITFDDGSMLLIRVKDQPTGFAFTSPGNAGSHGYIDFAALPGNPQFLDVKETREPGGRKRLEVCPQPPAAPERGGGTRGVRPDHLRR